MQLVDTECQPPADRVDHPHNYRQRWKMRWVINQTLRNWNVQVAAARARLRAWGCVRERVHGRGRWLFRSSRCATVSEHPCAQVRVSAECLARTRTSAARSRCVAAHVPQRRRIVERQRRPRPATTPLCAPPARAPAQDPRPHAAPRCSKLSLTTAPSLSLIHI